MESMGLVADVGVAITIIWCIASVVCSILLMAVVVAEVSMTLTCNTQKRRKEKRRKEKRRKEKRRKEKNG